MLARAFESYKVLLARISCGLLSAQHWQPHAGGLPAAPPASPGAPEASPLPSPAPEGNFSITAAPPPPPQAFGAARFEIPRFIIDFVTSGVAFYWHNASLTISQNDYRLRNPSRTDLPEPEQPGPGYATRAQTIVHLAMHDAFLGVYKHDKPYKTSGGGRRPGSRKCSWLGRPLRARLSSGARCCGPWRAWVADLV